MVKKQWRKLVDQKPKFIDNPMAGQQRQTRRLRWADELERKHAIPSRGSAAAKTPIASGQCLNPLAIPKEPDGKTHRYAAHNITPVPPKSWGQYLCENLCCCLFAPPEADPRSPKPGPSILKTPTPEREPGAAAATAASRELSTRSAAPKA